MVEKPVLIVFSQNKMGGVQNYYYNLLTHLPLDKVRTKWIFFENPLDTDAKLPQPYNITEEIVLQVPENASDFLLLCRKIKELIPAGPGIILTNFNIELKALHLYRQSGKTIYFICHDELYLAAARKYAFLIDTFIAHNYAFYEQMVALLPNRKDDIFYMPYGVAKTNLVRRENLHQPLKIIIAARMQALKGIYDLPEIDRLLKEKGINVSWTVVGDGPEKQKFIDLTKVHGNFICKTLPSNESVREELSAHDIFILPSRLDGLPVSLLEAMSVGCVPVISAFNTGIQRVVTEEVGFVLPVGDVAAFADKISGLHYNRQDLENRSQMARRKIEAEFDIDKRAGAYWALFQERLGFKKKYEFKFYNENGYLNNPLVPRPVRNLIRHVKRLLSGKDGN